MASRLGHVAARHASQRACLVKQRSPEFELCSSQNQLDPALGIRWTSRLRWAPWSRRQMNQVLALIETAPAEVRPSLRGASFNSRACEWVLCRANRDWRRPVALHVLPGEIFGPYVTLVGFETEAEALMLASDSRRSGASPWTMRSTLGHRVAQKVRAGIVWINAHHRNDPRLHGAALARAVGGEWLGRAL